MPERARLWLSRQVEQFRHGLTSIGDSYLMLLAILASVLQWSLVIAAIWFCGNAVGATASLVAVTATFVLIVIGLALPNAPMQVGTTQLALRDRIFCRWHAGDAGYCCVPDLHDLPDCPDHDRGRGVSAQTRTKCTIWHRPVTREPGISGGTRPAERWFKL